MSEAWIRIPSNEDFDALRKQTRTGHALRRGDV